MVARRGAEDGIHRALKVHRRAQLSAGAPSRGPEPGLAEDQIRLGADPCRGRAAQAQPRAELARRLIALAQLIAVPRRPADAGAIEIPELEPPTYRRRFSLGRR